MGSLRRIRWIGRPNWHSIHRLHVAADCWGGDEHGPARGYVDLSWGDRGSDPVWSAGWEFPVPERFMAWRQRRWETKHPRVVLSSVGDSPGARLDNP